MSKSTLVDLAQFKVAMAARMEAWMKSRQKVQILAQEPHEATNWEALPTVPGMDNSLWKDGADLISFPSTFSQKLRKIIHNLCAELGIFHRSLGEEPNRYISISRTGDFRGLHTTADDVEDGGEGEREINYSQYYQASVPKPFVVGRYYSAVAHEESNNTHHHAEKQRYVDSIVSDFAGVAPGAFVPLQTAADGEPVAAEDRNIVHYEWIDTEPQLQAVAEILSNTKVFAFDCEMHSYRSYHGLTCLLQIQVRDHSTLSIVPTTYLIDTIALWHHIHTYLAPAFANPAILKVAHACMGMDVPSLYRDFGIICVNVWDTQVCECVGLGNTKRLSLAAVVSKYGFTVDDDSVDAVENADNNNSSNSSAATMIPLSTKAFTLIKDKHHFTDWRMRPLTPEMCVYVCMDVHYLIDIFHRQLQTLIEMGRTATVTKAVPEAVLTAHKQSLAKQAVVSTESQLQPIDLVPIDEVPEEESRIDVDAEEEADQDDDGIDWNKPLALADVEDDIDGLGGNDEDDEDMWDGWGGETTDASASAASNVAPPAPVFKLQAPSAATAALPTSPTSPTSPQTPTDKLTRDRILSNPIYTNIHTVLAKSSEACTALWNDRTRTNPTLAKDSVDDETANHNQKKLPPHLKCQHLKDFKKRQARNTNNADDNGEVVARTECVLKHLFVWREEEARRRDESPDYICTATLMFGAALKLPASASELSILSSPLPHSMLDHSHKASVTTLSLTQYCSSHTPHDMNHFRVTGELLPLPPVDLVAAVAEAVRQWETVERAEWLLEVERLRQLQQQDPQEGEHLSEAMKKINKKKVQQKLKTAGKGDGESSRKQRRRQWKERQEAVGAGAVADGDDAVGGDGGEVIDEEVDEQLEESDQHGRDDEGPTTE